MVARARSDPVRGGLFECCAHPRYRAGGRLLPAVRAFMSADETLADLHRLIIQHFGWDDAHNYFFSQGCDRYEDPVAVRHPRSRLGPLPPHLLAPPTCR